MPPRLPSHARRHIVGSVLAALLTTLLSAADMTPERRAFFESKIRPVLVKQCYECHSADAKKVGGKLLLDSPGEMIGGGESGPVMQPGKPAESLLIQALRYEGPEMPPKHRLPESVVNDFVTWVKMGAPDPRVNAPKSARKPAPTDKASMWSFQPVTDPKPPTVARKDWPRDPLDAFILAQVEAAKLAPAKDAAPATLIRRLHFDLLGLPPTADQVAAFVRDYSLSHSPAVARLVDSLLASPHFGERWGRHWLDVARYGESNGNDGLSRNASFPHAWRYRDYVIQAFNENTPYDRFITEQLAGDLLPAESPAQRDRLLIATGFLAIGSKPAKAMNDNFDMDVVADQIAAIGNGIMGLSVGCARCHDHKHDPIPARDYYALAGIFKSTETLWGAGAYEKLTAPETPLHELKAAPKVEPARAKLVPAQTSKKAPAKPAFPYAPGTPLAMGVREAKAIADCKLNIDGESKKLGAAIPRGFLSACASTTNAPLAIEPQQSGRLQLAQWLTRGDHPQTARVMVNRIWLHLFGHGLVRTPDDFGVYGDRPSHPELLDHLATRFVADGWSIKRFIRALVLSRTYQLDSECDPRFRAADPDNTLFARHTRRRLDAESLRDTMLAASGTLDVRPGQGSLIQHHDVLINQMGNLHQPSNHRSIYLLHLRNSMPTELTAFNLPDGTAVTGQRDVTTLPTQTLYLLNSEFLVAQSKAFAASLLKSAEAEPARVRSAFVRTFAREPSKTEVQQSVAFLRSAESGLMQRQTDSEARQLTVWAAFCQALLASNELRYLD